jgi:PBP1b-binding outer membrane lipoprotein LpoB
MQKLKKHWKEILIVLLALLFIVNCNGKGNYRRKYEKQIKRTEYVTDSLNTVYKDASKYIDSLRTVIAFRETDIANLKKEISIYQDQNKKLANKPVVVKVEQVVKDEEKPE